LNSVAASGAFGRKKLTGFVGLRPAGGKADQADHLSAFSRAGRSSSRDTRRSASKPLQNLDDGDIWPTSFALKRLTAAVEEKIGKLVKRAAS
jgi:hypothetical protein